MNNLKTSRGRLLFTGHIEGVSFLVLLFIAMPLKYLAEIPEPVQVVGMIHGVLFIAYVICLADAFISIPLKFGKAVLAFIVSLIPFGTFFLNKIIDKPA